MIQLQNVTFEYPNGEAPIVDFSAVFDKGVFALFGESGSGKSTLLKGIAGILPPKTGTISSDMQLAMVFQENRLLPTWSALRNVELVCKTGAYDALCHVGLEEYIKKPVATLSGGQQRRVAIARALVSDAQCVLLDEPFDGLDIQARSVCAVELRKRFPLIIISSHNKQDFELLAGAEDIHYIFLKKE